MMWYKLSEKQKINIHLPDYLQQILLDIKQFGGNGILVGGIVRDTLLGLPSKDIDIEVYGLSFEQLENILTNYGKTNIVGKSFGVLKFTGQDGLDFDFNLPRTDSKVGDGHKDFKSEINPNLTYKDAFGRRDLTINAIGFDPLEKKIIDPYNGMEDIKNKVLRHTTSAFSEDALRPLRVMQFIGRFPGFKVAPETIDIIKQMKNQYKHLPKERVMEEFIKLVEKGTRPGDALQFLYDTEWSENFPEIQNIKSTPQDSEWHPEGNVSVHTAHVMNAAAEIADRRGLTGDDRAVAILAALGHDFAKATTTMQREKDGKMRWTAHGHEEAGGPVVQEFLKSIGVKNDIISRVVPLVRKHLNHIQHKDENISKGTIRGLAHELYPSTIEDLVDLVEADHSGRPPLPKELPQQAKWLLDAAKGDGVHNRKPPQILTGKHVLPWFNGNAGPHVGKAVKEAYDAYLKGKYTTPEEAEAWLRNYMKSNAQILRGQDVLQYFDGKGGPQVGQILDKAWDAQTAGEYTDETAAKAWLANYMKSFNQGA